MNRLLTIAAVLAVLSCALFAQSNTYSPLWGAASDSGAGMTNGWAKAATYADGVNDALDAIALLKLEQQLQGTNRTWGAMAEIVCERLHIERRK